MAAARLQVTTTFALSDRSGVAPGSTLRQLVRLVNGFPVECGVRVRALLVDGITHQACDLAIAAYDASVAPSASQYFEALLKPAPRRFLRAIPQDGPHALEQPLSVSVGAAPVGHHGPTYPVRTEVSADSTVAENGLVASNSSWCSADPPAGDMFAIRSP